MDDKQLQEIKARGEAATPGPWEFDGKSDIVPAHDKTDYVAMIHYSAADAAFIAHARADVPALVAEVERLRGMVIAANAALKTAQLLVNNGEMYNDDEGDCMLCGAEAYEDGYKHAQTCTVARLERDLEKYAEATQ